MNNSLPMTDRDHLSRFLLDTSGVRGVLVHLDETWQTIRQRSQYPEPVAAHLGETCAAAALFTGHVKVDGRLSVQLRGTGALRTLFAECTAAGTLRGIAHFIEPLPEPLTPRAFGPGSVLAITIENHGLGTQDPQRYQGLVGLDADELTEAFESYFSQSEQLPTRVLLAANADRAAALMLQQLPQSQSHPEDSDGWARASALFNTLSASELLDLQGETLLWRLFHDEGVRILNQQPLRFACSCSRARVEDMLRSLGQEEAQAACEPGQAEIHCDFCGQSYQFSAEQVAGLFHVADVNAPGSPLLQ
jgi:molecular chaperone Hsp33